MKKVITFLAVVIIGMNCFCQQTETIKTDYLRKSKNQKTAAWILLGGGAAMTVTGMVMYENSYNKAVNENPLYMGANANPTGAAIATVGLLSCAGSIPLFIASKKNKRRALSISTGLKMEKASVLQRITMVRKSYPAVSLKIAL